MGHYLGKQGTLQLQGPKQGSSFVLPAALQLQGVQCG